MKRLFAGMTAALLAVILVFSYPAQAISARSAIMIDSATGRVLYEKQATQKSLIASTTKIMTALLVCEQCNVLDRMQIPKEAVGVEGSSMYLREGEILTIQELLYGLMLQSGNDAAVALAIYCGGTVEGFVQMMNDKARNLGLIDTHYENPNGLDSENHYSTAADLASLASYAMKNPIFSKIVSTQSVRVGERYLRNHNKLLWQLEGADGVKTGYTRAAGRILVSSANRNERRLIVVTIADPNDWQDHITLMDSGFKQFHNRDIVSVGQVMGTVEVAGGDCDTVELIANGSFSYPLCADEEIELRMPEPGFVYAPVVDGQSAGYARVYLDEQFIGSIPLNYGKTVERQTQEKVNLWERLLGGK